jgi:rSAM/selenodomain-associated transferase 2
VLTAAFSKLSIVIPVGFNDFAWSNLLDDLAIFGNQLEIIIAACQTQPATISLSENARWIQVSPGRAHQLNAGAKHASGNVIWFLHADTRLTSQVSFAVQQYIAASDNSLGYFKLKFANDGPGQTCLNAWAANIRSRWFGLPFGDQGFIVAKTVFEHVDGFDEAVAQGEDLDFIVRLKAIGTKLHELPAELITSARRYQQHGWFTTTLRHLWLTCSLTHRARQRLRLSA